MSSKRESVRLGLAVIGLVLGLAILGVGIAILVKVYKNDGNFTRIFHSNFFITLKKFGFLSSFHNYTAFNNCLDL